MHLGIPLAPVLASAGFTARVPTRPGPAGPTLAAQESTGSSILLAWTRVDRCKSSSDRDAWRHHAVPSQTPVARRRPEAPPWTGVDGWDLSSRAGSVPTWTHVDASY